MHSLHFIVVRAESGEEACSEAESYIEDWGSENNWRTMCGAVSEDNVVYLSGEGRFQPDTNSDTIAKINKLVNSWLKVSHYGQTAKNLLAKGKKVETFNSQQAWSLKEYAEFLIQKSHLKQRKKFQKEKGEKVSRSFNVLKDTWFEGHYDENGVTECTYENHGKLWVVFCDMHS